MANDIKTAIQANPIKNGSVVTSSSVTGRYSTYNNFVNNNPSIGMIENKYDHRFYNGIFVHILSGDINGGSSLT